MIQASGYGGIGQFGKVDLCETLAPRAHMCMCNWGFVSGYGVYNGYCLPTSCAPGDMPTFTWNNSEIVLNNQNCNCGVPESQFSIVGFVLTGLFVLGIPFLCLYATIMSYSHEIHDQVFVPNQENSNKWDHPLAVFDIRKNWAALIHRDADRKYQALDGIRAFSMFWIISSHTSNLSLIVGFTNWQHVFTDVLTAFSSNLYFLSANFAVDSFFFLSGFLSSHVFLKKLSNPGPKPPIVAVLFGRWLRLVPLYFIVMLISWNIVPIVGSGPFWFLYINEIQEKCSRNWWTNLLFINNFLPTEYTDQCLPWTWYLANDFQFFIVGLGLTKL
jgi:hypothetical protein